MEKPAPADHPIAELLARRWSPRAFDADRPVPAALVDQLLEAARWSPSSSNEQPWRFVVFDESDPQALAQARDCLMPGNAWARRAPVLILTLAHETWTKNGTPNRHAGHDTGAAGLALLLEAVASGLHAHPMAGYDLGRVRSSFAIPDDHTPMAMIAVGYPGELDALAEKDREREPAPRVRRHLRELAFRGGFGKPYA